MFILNELEAILLQDITNCIGLRFLNLKREKLNFLSKMIIDI